VFICHASEDKGFVEPLAKALTDKNLKVWYDRFELKIGDALRQRIDHGLANSRYGIVVVSEAFFDKNWPQTELDALATRQNAEGRKVILPIWHGIEAGEVQKRSPLLASLLAARSIDGMGSVVSQILTVVSEPDESGPKSVFQTSPSAGLRERCLNVIRSGERPEWAKLVDELQSPVDKQLMAWKQYGEAAVVTNDDAWRKAVLKATEISLPGFVPLFAAVEAGSKDSWVRARHILPRLALLESQMGGGNMSVLSIGWKMLYVAGNIGMAIAVETGQKEFVWEWMRLAMPGFVPGAQCLWAESRHAFSPPLRVDYKDPFGFLVTLNSSDHLQGFFPSEEKMKEWLFKANLLQSLVELRLLTHRKEGLQTVEEHDTDYKTEIKVMPFWSLVKPSDFASWGWDLFESLEALLRFFSMDSGTNINRERFWSWWKGWKRICNAFMYAFTHGNIHLRIEWLMLPGEPQ